MNAKNEMPHHSLQTPVDRDLIRMFLQLTPEARILSNDNAINAIAELRDAFKKQRSAASRSQIAD
jgi:hypothetical protein